MKSIDVHYDKLGLEKCNECNDRAGVLWIERICLCEVCVSKLGATLSITLDLRRERERAIQAREYTREPTREESVVNSGMSCDLFRR